MPPPDDSDSRNDYPWLLRKAPGISVSIGSVIALSNRVSSSEPWLSNVLINVGSSIILVPVIAILGIMFGGELVKRRQAESRRIDTLERSVQDVRRSVEEVLSELSQRAVDQLAAERTEDELAIASVGVVALMRPSRRRGD